MQELMRHSSLRSTIDIYTQAVTPAKRDAQAAVLSLVFSGEPHVKIRSRSKKAPRWRPRRDLNPCYRRESPCIIIFTFGRMKSVEDFAANGSHTQQ